MWGTFQNLAVSKNVDPVPPSLALLTRLLQNLTTLRRGHLLGGRLRQTWSPQGAELGRSWSEVREARYSANRDIHLTLGPNSARPVLAPWSQEPCGHWASAPSRALFSGSASSCLQHCPCPAATSPPMESSCPRQGYRGDLKEQEGFCAGDTPFTQGTRAPRFHARWEGALEPSPVNTADTLRQESGDQAAQSGGCPRLACAHPRRCGPSSGRNGGRSGCFWEETPDSSAYPRAEPESSSVTLVSAGPRAVWRAPSLGDH